MTNANSITIDLAWYNILSEFSESIRRRVFDAILTFAATGNMPAFKGLAKLAFELIANEVSKQFANAESIEPTEATLSAESPESSVTTISAESSEPTENAESSEISASSETPDSSESSEVDEVALIHKYFEQYQGPEPLTIANADSYNYIDRERIYGLVAMSVYDMVRKGDIAPDDPQFMTTLNEVVERRFNMLHDLVCELNPSSILNNRGWLALFHRIQNTDPV